MCNSLVEATNKYLQKHFKEVMKSEEFSSLPLTDIVDIISRDELNIDSEEQVCGICCNCHRYYLQYQPWYQPRYSHNRCEGYRTGLFYIMFHFNPDISSLIPNQY